MNPHEPACVLAAVLIGVFLCGQVKADADLFRRMTESATAANQQELPLQKGPFQPTWESLKAYQVPEWFRDAKFGIWAHWGPQAQPEMGDWYARFVYLPNNPLTWAKPIYQFHVARYGHPSRFGFKDVINTWQAERWQPEQLMALYKRAGAQYFMALGQHHENFDLWKSTYQPWNSTVIGPKRDMVGEWASAARKNGLRFGVSFHGARAWTWLEPSQGADETGPRVGVPYDGKQTAADGKDKWWEGLDPQDLYAQNHAVGAPPDEAYMRKFYNRVLDCINQYNPDLVYFDDRVLPFYRNNQDLGLKIAAHFYNHSIATRDGKLEAVLNSKNLDEDQRKVLVYDIERGRATGILPQPWQTDTCIAQWHYDRPTYERHGYKKIDDVIKMLVDIVSKNGNLMLSIPVRGDGTLDDQEIAFLESMASWMAVNREAIFATRPWKVYGEGPSTTTPPTTNERGQARDIAPYTDRDIRFTASKDGNTVYVLELAKPGEQVSVHSLGTNAKLLDRPISKVELLGQGGVLRWQQTAEALVIQADGVMVTGDVVAFRISVGQ